MATNDHHSSNDGVHELEQIEAYQGAQFEAPSAKAFVTVATLGYALAWAATQLF